MKELDSNPQVVPVRAIKPIDPGVMLELSFKIAGYVALVVFGGAIFVPISNRHEALPLFLGGAAFCIMFVFSYALMFLPLRRQNLLNELWVKSQKNLDLSSDHLHGRGVIKSLQIAEDNFHKALSGLRQVAKESTSGETCFKCAVVLEKLAEPEGFSVNPEARFRDRSLVAATFLRAALLGSRPSQLRVAQLYQEGVGFVRDLTEAYAWFNLCAAHGNVEAERSRESLATSMSQAEITKAQQRSQELFVMVNGRN